MDNLQWFKFSPADWMMGRIQRQPAQVQVDFLRVCCQYWKNEGNYSIEDARLEAMDSYDVLVKYKIIKENNDNVVIEFLDEQLDGIEEKRKQASEAGKRSAEARKRRSESNDRSTTVKQPMNEPSTESNRVEKSREEKSREEQEKDIPSFDSFLEYALTKEPNIDQADLKRKYDIWVEDDWNDGYGKPIKSWKKKLLNTLQYIKKVKPLESLTEYEARKLSDKQERIRYCELKGIDKSSYRYGNIVNQNSVAF
jgi:hypothetical protein